TTLIYFPLLTGLDLGAIDLESDLAHAAARIVHSANVHALPELFRAAAGQRGDQNRIGILAFRSALIQSLAPVAGEAAQGLPLCRAISNSRRNARCCCNWAWMAMTCNLSTGRAESAECRLFSCSTRSAYRQ